MSVTFHSEGGILIDDPELEQMIADTCKITGETPGEAVHRAVLEAVERHSKDISKMNKVAF